MSRCSDLVRVGCVACAAAITLVASAAPGSFGFGKPATPAEIAGWDIDVRPDGTGLPPGRGTVAQGQEIYDAKCASCHGTFGESTDYMALAGGVGSLASGQPMRTTGSKLNHATTLFDYIRRAMPFPNPKTLTDDEVYALTAYVLHLNDILPVDAALDRDSLPGVRMPNRDGFTTAHGLTRKDGKPDTHNVACMHDCVREIRLSSEIPDYARDSHGNLAEQTRELGPIEGAITSGAPPNDAARPQIAPPPRDALATAQKAGCMTCHALATSAAGPAFREVSARYAGDLAAAPRLAAKIAAGGSGAWGAVSMPAQTISADDRRLIVDWILSGQY